MMHNRSPQGVERGVTRGKRQRPTRRVVGVLLGVFLGLTAGELWLRTLGYQGAASRTTTIFHPRYGSVRRDSWIFDFELNPPRRSHARIRGQHVSLPKPRDSTRVLFVGDSGTEGAFVPLAKSFPKAFERYARERFPARRLEVINAGVWGMTTIDEYHLLRDKLLPMRPDVVILGLFMSNDLNFNLAHAQTRVRQRSRFESAAWLKTHSALAHFVYLHAMALNERHRWLEPDKLESAHHNSVRLRLVDEYGLHMLSYPAGEIATYMKRPSRLMQRAYQLLQEVLSQFASLGEEHGFRFGVILVPSPSAVAGSLTLLHYPNIWQLIAQRGLKIRPEDLDTAAPTRRVLVICGRLGLVCADPTDRMRSIGLSAFFAEDEHLTPAGHDVLAHELLARLDELVPTAERSW